MTQPKRELHDPHRRNSGREFRECGSRLCAARRSGHGGPPTLGIAYQRWKAGWPSFTATKVPRQVAQTFPPAVNCPRPWRGRWSIPLPWQKDERRRSSASGGELDRVIGRHRTGRAIFTRLLHEMIRRGPVAVAIEQRPDNPAIQDARKGLIFRLWLSSPPLLRHLPENCECAVLRHWPDRSPNRHWPARIFPGAMVGRSFHGRASFQLARLFGARATLWPRCEPP